MFSRLLKFFGLKKREDGSVERFSAAHANNLTNKAICIENDKILNDYLKREQELIDQIYREICITALNKGFRVRICAFDNLFESGMLGIGDIKWRQSDIDLFIKNTADCFRQAGYIVETYHSHNTMDPDAHSVRIRWDNKDGCVNGKQFSEV